MAENEGRQVAAAEDKPRATKQHEIDRGHDSRADELSEEHAAHLEALAAEDWERPSALLAPEPQPGMDQRWVRISVRGADDPRNLNRKRRDGWRPRPAETIPDEWFVSFMFDDGDDSAPKARGYLQQDDLVLMERPMAITEARARAYTARAQKQMDGVNHDLERHVGQAMHTRTQKSAVSFPGRRVEAAGDDD